MNNQESMSKESLEIVDDFVFVVNDSASEKMILTDNSEHRHYISNIVQCEPNMNNSAELLWTVSNEERTNERSMPVLNRHESIEAYWEQIENSSSNVKSQPKKQTCKRKTMKEYNLLEHNKKTPRHPSYYNFDDATTRILETLLTLPLQMEHYSNIVGKGKNSVVIHASWSKTYYVAWGFAVKVYKLGSECSDVTKNKAILKKIQKEEEHLNHLYKTARSVYTDSFIGSNQETAPSINEVPDKDCLETYKSIVKEMNHWYKRAEIVHGNLSTKNIVLGDGLCYLGWAHSVRIQHPAALTKLMKDCHFVTTYFAERGVPVKTKEDLYKEITGFDEISSDMLEIPHKKDLWKASHLTNPNRAVTVTNQMYRKNRFK